MHWTCFTARIIIYQITWKKRRDQQLHAVKGWSLLVIIKYKPPCSGNRNTSQTPLDTASRAAQKKFSTMADEMVTRVIEAARGARTHELTTLEIWKNKKLMPYNQDLWKMMYIFSFSLFERKIVITRIQ